MNIRTPVIMLAGFWADSRLAADVCTPTPQNLLVHCVPASPHRPDIYLHYLAPFPSTASPE